MYESEKNFLERIADVIPGLKGYRAKESRRDTDKRLRDFMAAEIDRHRKGLDGVKRDLLSRGKLELLDDADRTAGKMQKCADLVRHASYGYSGLFDQVKIREEELDALYRYDSDLLDLVRSLDGRADTIASAEDPAAALREYETVIDELNNNIDGRKQMFNSPS